jgi:hypothetical protein
MDSEQDSLDSLRTYYEGAMTPDDLPAPGADAAGHIRPVAPTTTNTVTICPRGLICILGSDGSPLSGQPYALDAGGTLTLGSTDGRGWIELVDVTGISNGTLHVGEVAYALTFGPDLVDETTLAQSILNALGYSAGPLDGNAQERSRFAVACYQFDKSMPVTGQVDDATLAALKTDFIPS